MKTFLERWHEVREEALSLIDEAKARPNEGLHAALIEMIQRGALIECLEAMLAEMRLPKP